eukprot:13327-Eustigmatos_ZCMA.PRE.1
MEREGVGVCVGVGACVYVCVCVCVCAAGSFYACVTLPGCPCLFLSLYRRAVCLRCLEYFRVHGQTHRTSCAWGDASCTTDV